MNRAAISVAVLTVFATLPLHAAPHSGAISIFSGPMADATCAYLADRSVQCWGYLADAFKTPTFFGAIRSIALGPDFGCIVAAGGTAFCWGNNSEGQLGDHTFTSRNTLAPVLSGSGVLGNLQTISAGLRHVCATQAGGLVWCWGNNQNGQLGNFLIPHDRWNSPVAVIENKSPHYPAIHASSVTAGGFHTCAHADDGSGACWGSNSHLQLALDRSILLVDSPAWGVGFGPLAAGGAHTCGSNDSKSVTCWGMNQSGQAGFPNTDGSEDSTPENINSDTDGFSLPVSSLAMGEFFSCGIRQPDRSVRCWGANDEQQIGGAAACSGLDCPTATTIQLTDGTSITDAQQLIAGVGHACVLLADHSVRCWGANYLRQSGVDGGDSLGAATMVKDLDSPIFFDDFEID